MVHHYRIVNVGNYKYDVQEWRWWWPFWITTTVIPGFFYSVEDAERYIRGREKGVVKTFKTNE